MSPTEVKLECERIWREDRISFAHNIAGWHTTEYCKRKGLGYYVGKLFTSFKGKRSVTLKRKAK